MLKTTVLLANRSTFRRFFLASGLRRLGFDVIAVAKDDKEAVLKYAQYSPDIALIDLKQDGLQVIRALKRNYPAAVVALIMPKKKDDPDLIYEAGIAGASVFINNPASCREMKKRLAGLMENGSQAFSHAN